MAHQRMGNSVGSSTEEQSSEEWGFDSLPTDNEADNINLNKIYQIWLADTPHRLTQNRGNRKRSVTRCISAAQCTHL